MAPGGETIVLQSQPRQPYEVSRVKDGSLERISRVNDQFLEGIQLGRVERIRARSADGTMIDAFLTRPPRCARGRAASAAAAHPRRSGFAVHHGVQHGMADPRRAGVRRGGRQPAWLVRLRPGLQLRHLGRLGQQGLPGCDGGPRQNYRHGCCRSGSAGCRRLELRGHPHKLCHHADRPLQSRDLGRERGELPVELRD